MRLILADAGKVEALEVQAVLKVVGGLAGGAFLGGGVEGWGDLDEFAFVFVVVAVEDGAHEAAVAAEEDGGEGRDGVHDDVSIG